MLPNCSVNSPNGLCLSLGVTKTTEETRSWPSVQLLGISTVHRCFATMDGSPILLQHDGVPRSLDRRTRFGRYNVAYSFAEYILYNLFDRRDTHHDPQAIRSYSHAYGTRVYSCETRKLPPRRRYPPSIWSNTPCRRVNL
jgi:hypothetical protein